MAESLKLLLSLIIINELLVDQWFIFWLWILVSSYLMKKNDPAAAIIIFEETY